MYTAETCGEL